MIIHLCINDPDNGNHTDRLFAIQFDDWIKLELAFIPDPNVVCRREGSNQLRVGRKLFSIQDYETWVGNWCWDAAWMDDETATKLLAYVQSLKYRGMRKFEPEEAYTPIWDKYIAGERIVFPVEMELSR